MMGTKNNFIKVLLLTFICLFAVGIFSDAAFAGEYWESTGDGKKTSTASVEDSGTTSADSSLNNDQSRSGTGRSISGSGCQYVTCSRATGWVAMTVNESGFLDFPGMKYGSIDTLATKVATGNAPPGSTFYVYGMFAANDGYVTMNGVRTAVHKGDFLIPLSAAGLPKADGTYAKEYAADYYAKQIYGMTYRKDSYGIPESEIMALYQSMLASGMITRDASLIEAFNAFGGLDGLALENTNATDIADILKILTDLGYDPTPVEPPIPLLSCHGGNHYGWAEGKASVQNMTTGTGWTGEVWARPGDTVQFMIQYCWGVGAVGGSLGNASSPYAIYPGGAARAFGSAVNEVWFSLSGTQNAKYLFGANEEVISGGTNGLKRILANPHASNIGGTGVGFGDGNVDKTGDYAFTVLSPGSKDAGRYACTIYDFSPFYTSPGYQIPGVAEGSCPAISNNGGIMSDVSHSAGIISQTIKYNYATAWQMWRHNETGYCCGQCTFTPKTSYAISYRVMSEEACNQLTENNANVRGNPFQSMAAAAGAGVNDWGLIVKHGGDTATHPRDCDSSLCGCNYWQQIMYKYCRGSCKEYNTDPVTGARTGCAEYEMVDCPRSCADRDGGPMGGGGSCDCTSHPGHVYYDPQYDWSTGMQDLGERASTASVNVPYNYYTSARSGINASDRIYLGEKVSSNFAVSILPRSNTSVHNGEPYATIHDGRIEAVEFIVSANDDLGGVGGSEESGAGPCDYYRGKLSVISGCNTIWSVDPMLNPQGRYSGWTYTNVTDRVVPDNPNDFSEDLVGARYCVAVGISHTDSHGVPSGAAVSGMSHETGWRISGASCRTIAKKPNFQVWNGNMYTNGSILTSQTRKHVDAHLGDSSNPTGLFGSWDEYYVMAHDQISGFSSGAGLGYYGKDGDRNTSLGLMGGNSPNVDLCDISKMTIANANCKGSDIMEMGYSNTLISVDKVLDRLYSRYTNPSSTNEVTHLANGATYVNYNGDINTSQIQNLSGAHSSLLTNTDFTGSYIRQTKSSVNSESEQTTSNYASNTLVIYVTGKLTIDTNICTGTGDCSDGNNGGYLTLQGRNSDWYTNIYSLPQVIIIAKGGINVTQSVNQIDAWVVTEGNINTCTEFSVGSGSSETCYNPLIFNGPVFAKSITLNRTAGANPGSGTEDTSDVRYKNLANDGSITPGEIFNLRPDSLLWAYGQSQRFTQANVTYTRELAPRY